ncbi:3-hydroxyacyl-CoA dehydrogenase NAD-binding domain-containing protein [Frigidibacter sp. ROC022]|uniref:3-hydroxyacyl-CoA dehydrogenase NAD-binding domain-containing protein n=1 Tax=Frigidibacter sp. ROC022 TaxID=2971796 RepID=UPI00215AEB95|nr:3-hydroxyacyl-CoA dehydrogenase NAD-binding domain-containing protein [Frigidibacter sp. ROC022]MCR8724091.1 3-hydroxyacyl-CoA dehydrogenase NAD-binding domain-containing protein [Frigidibacter sp. ROC022]
MGSETGADRAVRVERVGRVALLEIDNPPVNALGSSVRAEIQAALRALQAEESAGVIAIHSAGRTFSAGADIREFGKPPRAPAMPDLYDEIEASAIPVIAVMQGMALGGGLELALACHARIGIEGLKVGQPEVLIGLLPGAGGTQRLPRLTGVPAALDICLSGRKVPAEEALKLGILDRLEAGETRAVALDAAEAVLSGRLATRRTSEIDLVADPAALEAARDRLRRTQPHLVSPLACVDAIEAAALPLAEGLKVERQRFLDCMDTPQRAGLIHAFFVERAVANVPEKSATPRPLSALGVIGGGTMGSGIATAALLAGLSVTLDEVSDEALARGVSTITRNLDGAVKRGKLAADARDSTLARLTASTEMADLGEADLIIEAVFENMEVKKDIFTRLDKIAKPGAVLASNTSYLNINEIAAATSRPGDVLGLHFFSPAHVMRLLEIVVADRAAPEVVATGFALARRLGKVGVRAGVCDGFIGNRILSHYLKEATYLLMDGASPAQIDRALEDFGFAMGPFRVSDLAGLDIGWAERKRKAPMRPPEERYVPIADVLCEHGWFGRKTGQGYYDYSQDPAPPYPPAMEVIEAERAKAGIVPRSFPDEEIVERYMTAMISEAARVVEDGIALRPADVDAVFLFGYGFPRFRGGPLHYADTLGAAEIVSRIERYAAEDPHYWQVPALLRRMAEDGGSFDDLNRAG